MKQVPAKVAPVAVRPQPQTFAIVPPPEKLGIVLPETVTVPPPAELGIQLK